jgi:hypothetical protein
MIKFAAGLNDRGDARLMAAQRHAILIDVSAVIGGHQDDARLSAPGYPVT